MVLEFIRSIATPAHGAINTGVWDFYLDFTQEKFIDEIEDE